MNITQGLLHAVEEGKARILTRLLPFIMALLVIILCYDFRVFQGLDDAQSMDNAQVARQVARGSGFTTKFIRPYALGQLSSWASKTGGPGATLFPQNRFPKGTERILPDTYNSPGYPYLLAGWFALMQPKFDETPREIAQVRTYIPDHRIPWLNQIFLAATALLLFLLGLRVFDVRVAWMSMTGFFLTNLVWQYSITALSTTYLMFLMTVVLFVAVEIYAVGESCFESTEAPFWPAWVWTLLLAFVLGLACLTRLHLLILVVPLLVFLLLVPQGNKLIVVPLALIVLGMTVPWFLHLYHLSGSWVGSNVPLLHYGTDGFDGNQVYCTLGAPNYEQLFKDVAGKEFTGFTWTFAHGWDLLGTNALVILFFTSILHNFKRGKAQAFRWLILGMGLCLIAANNFAVPKPTALDPWNTLVILLPGIIVVGSAYFFILVDRLHLELWLLHNAITVAMLILIALPMIGVLLDARGNRVYPPYVPASLRAMGDYVQKDEWITADMPWAVAWYGDRSSVWLPDTLADFNEIYDDYNESGLLLITPVLLGTPATTFTSGEYKEWYPFISGGALPAHFPLDARAPAGTGFIEYLIFGRRNGP